MQNVDDVEEHFDEGIEQNKPMNARGVIFIKSNSYQIKVDKVSILFLVSLNIS